MQKLTSFVVKKIEEKLNCAISEKGACAELRRNLANKESEDGKFALNTIKRWFGVLEKQVEPQQNGLEAIAEYLGYPSWVTLTLELEYNQTKVKTEEDYISELFPDYKNLLQGIQDYQFKKGKAKIEEDIIHYEEKIDELKKRQNTLKDAIVQLSNLVTDLTPYQSDLSSIEKLFESEHYEEANQLLDEDRLKEEQTVLFRSLKKKDHDEELIRLQLKRNAQCFYFKAEICKSLNQINEAENFYLLSLESKQVFNTLFNLGEFYHIQRQDNKKALPYFEEINKRSNEFADLNLYDEMFFCENLYRTSILLDTWFYLGKIYFDQKDFEKGHKTMALLLKAYSTLKDENTQRELQRRIADVYNEQGNAFSTQKDHDNAEAYLKKALNIYKLVSEIDYAETAINLSYVYVDKGDFESAKKVLKQMLNYFKSLFDNADSIENQQKYRMGIAKCHFAFGFVNWKNKDLQESIHSYRRAIITFDKMNEIIPSLEAKLEAIKAWSAIAGIYKETGNQEKNDECYEKMGNYLKYEDVVSHYIEPIVKHLKREGLWHE